MSAAPPVTHCPDREAWLRFQSGANSADELALLSGHLEACGSCRSVLDSLEEPSDELIAGLRSNTPNPFGSERDCRLAIERIQQFIAPAGHAIPAELPTELGSYLIRERIGRGGMGRVYRATHVKLGREVALKVLPRHRWHDVASIARFHRETAALGPLDHPNIVRATDAGEAGGLVFLVMDLVDGIDLGRVVRERGPLPVAAACKIVRQTCDALQYLGERGLVHRDVKPSNIMLGAGGRVKLLDFGLAVHGLGSESESAAGTWDYLAPEQADPARGVDSRADIYSLGCTLFHLLAGRAPFSDAVSAADKERAHAETPPPNLRAIRADVPAGLAAVVDRMMAKQPDDRFASAAEVAAALEPFSIAEARPESRRRYRATAAIAVASIAILGGVLLASGRFQQDPPVTKVEPQPEPPVVAPETPLPATLPIALMGFEERGGKDFAPRVADLLFAQLAGKPGLDLVDRTDLKTILDEQALNASGAVKPDEAVKVGQLTGAKLLITGSVIHADKKVHLVVKVIGTETGRVSGVSVEAPASGELGALVSQLADRIVEKVQKDVAKLCPPSPKTVDRLAELNRKLGAAVRPAVWGARPELESILTATGFTVLDAEEGSKSKADVLLTGSVVHGTSGHVAGLESAFVRVEWKAVDRVSGKVIAAERQTERRVDRTAAAAQEAALRDATMAVAERLLPKLVGRKP